MFLLQRASGSRLYLLGCSALAVRFGVMLLMKQSNPTKSAAASIAAQSRYNHRPNRAIIIDRSQRQIDAMGKQIDQLAYELYGLTDEEIRIAEEATK